MGNEDEEASKLSNPSLQVEDESMNATAAVAGSHEAVQDKTEPQCEPESAAEFSEPQLLPTGEGKEIEEAEVTAGGYVGNDEDVVHGGDLVVPEPEAGAGEGVEEDVIGELEREVDDVAEEKEEKAEQKGDDVAVEAQIESETKVDDVAEVTEVVGGQKGDDVAVEAQIESEMKVDDVAEVTEVVGGQKGDDDDVAAEAQIENERKLDDVAEETAIVDERAEIGGERGVACDKAEETETLDERKAVDVAGETDGRVEMAEDSELAGETVEVDVAEEEKAKEINVADLAEETVDETKSVDVAVENVGSAEMAEDREIAGETREFDVAGDKEMAKEINRAGLGREMTSDEDKKVEDVTEMTVAAAGDEMEVGDVAVGETEVEEGMEKAAEETEMLEASETEEMEVGRVGEETMKARADIEDETKKDGTAEEMETGEDVEEVSKTVGGKRKRAGKNSKSLGKAPSRKKSEEDVCFICFDGGDLVLCDRRGCPKAYHPSCVNRDEAFFRAKGRWNCGWHLCSICEKNAYYMCYTCTFSLCKGCIKDAVILCVRGNKGFCETCMKTVMLIEKKEQGNKETGQVDFDDRSSWEYLFKDYWLDLKGRLSLSSDELTHAKNPWKGSDIHAGKPDSPDELYDGNADGGHGSDSSSGNAEATVAKRRKAKKRSKSRAKDGDSPGIAKATGGEGSSTDGGFEWASKELLELVMHMRNGDKSVLSQFDVQTLLLEYIKKYKLRDPQRRTHVICDARLQNLFGKPRVGHFEMLKLLESHFLTKEDSQVDELQGSVVDNEANQSEADGNSDALVKGGKDKKRKIRKKGDHRGLQSNLDDYAAIDMHNINLIYLRRNLVEELLEDAETFHDKVVGTFARIRISGSVQKQDLYRLVQVTGTSKGAEPYKVGKRMTDIMLEILNLSKTEIISVDIISNQGFTEDECKRLRQSIKCGLINRLTVGDIQEKAMALQEVRVKDWMEAEILRLSHLRDRASDLGRRKELRECVEKLQLLKTPEERQRRLEEIPEIHSDPKMDPSYESEEDVSETDDKRGENFMRPRGSGFSRRGREPISPGGGGSFSNDSLSGSMNYSGGSKELTRNVSNRGFSNKGDDFVGGGEIVNESLWNPARDRETQQLNSGDKPRTASYLETGARNPHSVVLSESISRAVSENSTASASAGATQPAAKINESEKIWHYQDPSGKVQGPFSVVQLRKWNNTGYFPSNLRIWRSNEKQDDSILLTDALAGKFHKDPPMVDANLSQTIYSGKPHGAPSQQGMESQVGGNSNFDQNRTVWNQHGALGSSGQSVGGNWKPQPEISSTGGAAPLLELPKKLRDGWGGSETNLPSPTPIQGTAGETREKTFEKEWSPTPINQSGSLMMTNLFPGSNRGKQSPTVTETGQLAHFSTPSSTSKLSVNEDGLNVTHGVISPSKPETGESHRVLVSPHQLPASDSVVAPMNPGVDLKNIGATLQTLVQSVNTHIAPVESHGWGSGLAARPEMMTTPPKPVSGSQSWENAPSQKLEPNNPASMPTQSPAYAQPYASAFNTGNSPGFFSASGQSGMPASDSWRPPVPTQSNVQPAAQPITPWGMGVTGNQSAEPRQGPENQNTSWGQMSGNPSMGWGGQLPASTNMNWGAPVQAQSPGNAHSGWPGPAHGQPPKNAVPGWAAPGQGPLPVNANPGWVAPGQGLPPGNGNPGVWGSEQKNNSGDRFLSQRDRGGDAGYGGGRPWNRQSSFGNRGGDSSRPHFNKGQRVCKFHESGHCKKGSQCDYLHT